MKISLFLLFYLAALALTINRSIAAHVGFALMSVIPMLALVLYAGRVIWSKTQSK